MTVYKYVGRNKRGSIKRGTIDSETKRDAINELKEKGISLRQIEETKATIFNKGIGGSKSGGRVKNKDFVIYCRQFATLIRASIPLVQATHILAQQSESKALRSVLLKVEHDVNEGVTFSRAIEKFPKIFPHLFISMMKTGEVTGNIDESLERMANYYEKQYELKKKVQSMMMYPAVLAVLIIGVVIFMLLSIVPNFVQMFAQFDAELPAITKLVLKMSEIVQKLWWLVLLIVVTVVTAFIYMYKKNKDFHFAVSAFTLRIPAFGKILQKAGVARAMSTLSSLFKSSVPILTALGIVEQVAGNPVIAKVFKDAKESLEQGSPLSEPMIKSWVIPPLVSQMTAIGEQTGSLDFMLEKVAEFYEAEVDRAVEQLKSLIEPLMIIIMAVVVGFILMAIMIPMFSIFTEIK